jgi:hypothetical protein
MAKKKRVPKKKAAPKKPNGFWTLKKVQASAKKFATKSEWAYSDQTSYRKAIKNGWLEETTKHMKSPQKPKGYWSKERCEEDAKKYKSRQDWFKRSSSAYLAASRNKWLDLCCAHISVWTLEKCKDVASQFMTMSAFMRYAPEAYRIAKKNGWLKECCVHMK